MHTRFGRLDLMQHVQGVKSYERLRAGSVAWQVPGVEAPMFVAGRDDLVAMKLAAGREQDLLDISELARAAGLSE